MHISKSYIKDSLDLIKGENKKNQEDLVSN